MTRLTAGDRVLAGGLFELMSDVFGEAHGALDDAYVRSLLERPDFWALAAQSGAELVGGLTAHTLPMTRAQTSEVFIYDIAVRSDEQRRGVGRALVDHLRRLAEAAGIDTIFVPVDRADAGALAFYRAIGGSESDVSFFTFDRRR